MLLVIAAVFAAVYLPSVPSTRYDYDESDYMMAARMGLVANYLDRPSMSLWEFVQTGLNRGVKGASSTRTELSHQIRESRDITFFRHYHGPVTFYVLALNDNLFGGSEQRMRAIGFVFHFLTFAVVYFACLIIANSRWAAALGGALALLSTTMIQTNTSQVSTHPVYVLALMLTLAALACFLKFQTARLWYAAIVLFGVTFCTLEYAVLLFPTFAVALFAMRKELFAGWSRSRFGAWLGRSVGLFLATVAVLWPTGLFQLKSLEGFANLVYLAAFRKGSFGQETVLGHWSKRISRDPIEYALMILALVIFVFAYRKLETRRLLLPFAVYAGLFWLTTIKNTSLNPRYVSSLLPPLYVLAGVLIGGALTRFPILVRYAAIVAIVAGMAFTSYERLLGAGFRPPPKPDLITSIENQGIGNQKVLVPWTSRPQVDYYFEEMAPFPYPPEEAKPAEMAALARSQGFAGVICPGGFCEGLKSELGTEPMLLEGVPGAAQSLYYVPVRQ